MHGKCGVCLSTKILFVLTWTSLCEGKTTDLIYNEYWVEIWLLLFNINLGTAFVDRVCTLAKSEGEKCPSGGGGEEKMYYFDSTKEKCTSFTYLGCAGNQNKFEASDDCIDSCQTPWFIKKNKEEDKKNPGGEEPHKKSDCSLPYEAGPCKGTCGV